MKKRPSYFFSTLLRVLLIMISAQGCNATSTTIATNTGSGGAGGGGTTTSTGQVSLTWSAAQGGPQGYLVEQSTDGVNFSQIKTVSNSATSTTVTGLTHGTTYYFRMRSYNQTSDSSYTSTVAATP